MLFLSVVTQGLFFLVISYFALYVVLELRVVLISKRVERKKLSSIGLPSTPVDENNLPKVSVLLPVCNESNVVERLIDAVCGLVYPTRLLEILVLDDSTDRTTSLAAARVAVYAATGINIRLLKREDRRGFKAGNLIFGTRNSTGDFVAIFDADFIPPKDFLSKTIPCFKDEELGFLQTGIGYVNRDVSFLTKFQAMEMGHQQFVTVGLNEDGDMASLSGSSCVWRRRCIEDIGGWSSATITEDVDIGYRAQFGDWKYAFLRDIVSLSELPESVSAFRVQRERWGRGLIHSAFKFCRQMLGKKMPFMKRLHAFSVMFSSLLLASIYVLIILTLPLVCFMDFEGELVRWGVIGFFVMVAVWVSSNFVGSREGRGFSESRRAFQSLTEMYAYVAMFLPMSWYYFAGGVRALAGVSGEFNRTPKGHEKSVSGHPRINTILLIGEILTFLYSAATLLVGIRQGNMLLVPINFTACVGFGMVIYWSWREREAVNANA
jgi:cellulose synthase/poly-beta-1,6-N-acetylglucosamine synthase-like glycosyltransferase